ncbi:hypothetical protein [Marinilactibacillus sp. Marseille-P9653]|uniref:hypothetical protein n=1 Tax=Marinilactibacillus sp. Marseille-P9653 TaxID=2866583 RepID=UPI001CE3BD3B|nr:hypothetical protein [Marinilactibacillus sp. Marseille-P9653]
MSHINKRLESDELYVLNLIADIIGENYKGQMRFDTLLGDSGKSGRRVKLPVDAFFPAANLIVEYREKQHSQPVGIMDKRMTISGVSRGEQRRLYDLRKEQWALDNKVDLLVISYFDLAHKKLGKLKRDSDHDRVVLKNFLDFI